MIKGIIDSYELWQSRPENLNENMEDPIKSAEHRGWNQCNRSWIKTIEEQPRVGEWIPCSERLPEEGAVVLVSLEKDEDYEWVRLVREGYHDEDYWYDTDGAHYGVEVIAWMPLPEAYKVGDQE